MKKYIITCIATLMGILFAQADNISVQDLTMDVGQSGSIDICLTNTATNYVSFQMDLYLPDDFTLNKTGNTLSDRFSIGELTIGKQSDGAYRLTATSFSLNPITGTSGVLLTLSVSAPSSTTGIANIRNILFATSQSTSVTMSEVSFTMTAVGDQSLSLSSLPTMTYGDEDYTLPLLTDQGMTLTWSVNNTSVATVSGNTLTIKRAGSAVLTASAQENVQYHAFSKEYTLTVNNAPLTITPNDATITYGNELPVFEVGYNGFKNGEDASILTKQPEISCAASSSSPTGIYAITASGAEAPNYDISYVNGTLTIEKRAQTATLDDELVLNYGDNQYGLLEETDQGLPFEWSCDNPSVAIVTGSTLIIKGAGTAVLLAEQNGDRNSLPLTKEIILTVNKAPLTVTAQSYTIEQGQPLPTFDATYEGFVNNQTANVLTTKPTFACESTNSDVPGTYTITPSGAEAKNYEISYVAGTLTITPQPAVTVTAKSYTIQYGDAVPELEFTAEGNELYGTPELACEATSLSPVGIYEITVSKGSLKNFNVTYVAGTLTIEKAPLTITANSYTKKQGDPLPIFEATYSGFKNGETESVLTRKPTLATLAEEYSDPGEYEIIVGGAKADNYEISYVNGTLTVEQADLVTVTAKNYTIQYGDELPELEFTIEGAALTGTPELNCEATTTSPVGTYPIIVSKGTVENYNATFVSGTLTIEKAPLTVTANSYTMDFGGSLPTFDAVFEGFKNNETISVLTTQPTISCQATANSEPGTYDIEVSGAQARNYEIIYVKGTLTIGKRTQTIAIDENLMMTYGEGTYSLPEETEQGLLIDWISDNTAVATIIGSSLIIKGAGTATLTAEQEGNNNNLPMTKDITLTVNKAPLTVTAKSYTIEQGRPLPSFGATYEGFVNNQTEKVLTKQPTFTCEAANSDIPGTYTITPSGAEAKNYEMSYVAGTLTITSQPSATVTALNYTIQYGDEIPEFDFTTEGAELSGIPELTCEATSASPVGTYEITVTKGSVENYNVTYVAGTLTIEKAPLTITAQSYSMVQGEEFPEFEALYDGFKNGETENVLKRKPQLATLADEYSGPGEYEIFVSGARSDNYDITYVNGTLTIEANSGIATYIAKIPGSSVVLRSKNGEITVEGLTDGQRVSIHTYGGMLIGTATTVDGKATINTSLTPGSIVIVRVGNKTVKYVVR